MNGSANPVTGKTGFPSLKPTMVITVAIGQTSPIGEVSSGANSYHFTMAGGSIKSVPGSGQDLDLEIVAGADWLYFDNDKQRGRLNVRGVAKDAEGVFITFGYTGIVTVNEAVGKIFSFSPEAKTIGFGQSTTIHTFEAGHPKYKYLENKSWAANGRLIVHPDGPTSGVSIESRVAEVVPSTDIE